MPTQEQMDAAIAQIKEVIGDRYMEVIQSGYIVSYDPDLRKYTIAFPQLRASEQVEILQVYGQWEGFTEAQEENVSRRVIDGESPDFWMDGIAMDDGIPSIEEMKAINRELRDNEAQRPLHEKGVRYEDAPEAASQADRHEQQLKEAAGRGRHAAKGRDKGRER